MPSGSGDLREDPRDLLSVSSGLGVLGLLFFPPEDSLLGLNILVSGLSRRLPGLCWLLRDLS